MARAEETRGPSHTAQLGAVMTCNQHGEQAPPDNPGKTEPPARLTWPSWSRRFPTNLPENPCHSSTWINKSPWLTWKHLWLSGVARSLWPLPPRQPSFLHFSHLSFDPTGQWLRAPLSSPQSRGAGAGNWAVGVPLASCSLPGAPGHRTVSLCLKVPCCRGCHFMSTVSQVWELTERSTERRDDVSDH